MCVYIHIDIYIHTCTHIINLNVNFPPGLTNAPFKSQRTANKNPGNRHEKVFFWVIDQGHWRDSPNIMDYAIVLVSPSEVDGKCLSLKTRCTPDVGPRSLWAGTDGITSSLRTSFVLPEGTAHSSKEEKQPVVPLSYETTTYEAQRPTSVTW